MRTLAILAGLALASTSALAADINKAPAFVPAAPAPAWTGFYLGVNGGGGWSTKDQTIMGADKVGAGVVASGFVPSDVATRGSGGLFGVTAGYNYQIGATFVVGAEADFDWANIGGSGGQSVTLGKVGLSTSASEKLNWLGSLRARAGYLVTPTTLLFATGGGAFGQANSSTTITLAAPPPFGASAAASSSSTKWGWTVGGGIEQMIFSNWSIRGQYLYTDLGAIDNSLGATVAKTPVNFATDQPLHFHTVTLGLNYRF